MKKALIVGVNDYAPIGNGGPDLRGCVNDARDFANTLVICGFFPLNIRILTNQHATRANILAYLKALVANSVKGDSIVFYYSGHGTRVANIGRDFEIDGLDEAICPHDYATAGVIRDDDFKNIFSTLKTGVNLEVIFDCCHSGTITRSLDLTVNEGLEVKIETPRFIPPLLEDEFYISYANEANLIDESENKISLTRALVPVASLNHFLWSASKDNQVAMEGTFNGQIRGYFTYHLCKILRATNGKIKRSLLDVQLTLALATMGAAQRNQSEGKKTEFNQLIFT